MKKATLTLTTFCLLSTVFLMGLTFNVQPVKAEPKTIYVDDDNTTGPWYGTPQYPFNKTQDAIRHAHPAIPDTIFVCKGIYYENIVVTKSVVLVGEDRDSTIIDGRGTGSVIYVTENNVSITGFTIRNSGPNDYSGIHVSSVGNKISCNILTDNTYGIRLYSSRDNLISDNNVSNNDYGISLDYSGNNVISDNNVSNNDYGIRLDFYSDNNTIYHNNFINNIVQRWCDSRNVWDNGIEGNYWSDYTGQDTNGDGIGDAPYNINANTKDNHPLMGIFSEFKIPRQGKTHHVTTVCNSRISDLTFEIGTKTGNKIISFNVTGENGTVGFCRIMIPTQLMNYSYIILVDEEEIVPTVLDVSNKTHAYLYFTYVHSSHTVTIISSRLLYLYNELLDKYVKLQIDFYADMHNMNSTYHELLDNYSALLDNYTSLLMEHAQNIRSLMYVFIATTAIFIIAAVYLSTHAHRKVPRS